MDFLKIDAEGFEPDILLADIEYIKNNVEFIQFEYASTWIERSDLVSLKNIYDIYKDAFSFHFLYDPNHPVSTLHQTLLVSLDDDVRIGKLEECAALSFGANIFMLKED